MYRRVLASQIASMFNEFDLEDFGDAVKSKLLARPDVTTVIIRYVDIFEDKGQEYIYVRADIDDATNCRAKCRLDRRRVHKPRDLIANYAEHIATILVEDYSDIILSATYSMDQEFTSKQTASGNGSFNKGQGRVPALFKKISWRPNTVNFDYGCGYKSTQDRISEFLADKGVEYIGFDKFNQTPAEQEEAWSAIEAVGGADTATCANVLNVVKERDVRVNEIIANVYDVLKSGGTAYFDVYEGDRSSTGGQTGKDNYQLKRPIDSYVEEVAEIFGEDNVKLKGKIIMAKK